jgi:hypothetical protein
MKASQHTQASSTKRRTNISAHGPESKDTDAPSLMAQIMPSVDARHLSSLGCPSCFGIEKAR